MTYHITITTPTTNQIIDFLPCQMTEDQAIRTARAIGVPNINLQGFIDGNPNCPDFTYGPVTISRA